MHSNTESIKNRAHEYVVLRHFLHVASSTIWLEAARSIFVWVEPARANEGLPTVILRTVWSSISTYSRTAFSASFSLAWQDVTPNCVSVEELFRRELDIAASDLAHRLTWHIEGELPKLANVYLRTFTLTSLPLGDAVNIGCGRFPRKRQVSFEKASGSCTEQSIRWRCALYSLCGRNFGGTI